MSAVKKATKIITVILAVILLFAGISYLFLKPLYYRFFYFGDRITGTISVTTDGEKYDLKASDLSATHDNEKDIKIGFRNEADAAAIAIHGGEYGPYTLMIHIDGIDFPLEAVIYQYNWYNISKFDLDVSIDHETETITFSSTAQVLSENGELDTENRSTTVGFSDGKCIHYIVTV
jgi:hypothetical protein